MTPLLTRLTAACAGAMLLACAGVVQRGAGAPPSAEESYLLARSHHLAQRPASALPLYQAALRASPAHANARNGLAALYAEQGQLDLAIPIWEEMTAAAPESGEAHLFVNLGHAYLLRGDSARAQAMLEQACLRDPLNPRAWDHLGTALANLGQHKRAKAMQRQAAALRRHDIESDYAVARGAASPAIGEALRAAREDGQRWARTEIERDGNGVFILRRIEPEGAAPIAAAPPDFPGNVLFEISNGNGVTGMARALSGEVGQGSGRQVRVTNQRGFGVKYTRVEYKAAFKVEAERLAGQFGASRVVPVGKTARADVRLVLGRDFVRPARAALVQAPPAGKKAG